MENKLLSIPCDYCSKFFNIKQKEFRNRIRKHPLGLIFHPKCFLKAKNLTKSKITNAVVVEIFCTNCQKIFSANFSQLRKRITRYDNLFCSRRCSSIYNRKLARNWNNKDKGKTITERRVKSEEIIYCSYCEEKKVAMVLSGASLYPEKGACWEHEYLIEKEMLEAYKNGQGNKLDDYCDFLETQELVGITSSNNSVEAFLNYNN